VCSECVCVCVVVSVVTMLFKTITNNVNDKLQH